MRTTGGAVTEVSWAGQSDGAGGRGATRPLLLDVSAVLPEEPPVDGRFRFELGSRHVLRQQGVKDGGLELLGTVSEIVSS